MPSAYAYHRQVENVWLVRQRDRRRLRELALVVLLALPVALALLTYTYLHVRVLDTAYRIDELESELRDLDRQRDALAVEAAQRAAVPEVERRAVDELGMVGPRADHTLTWHEVVP